MRKNKSKTIKFPTKIFFRIVSKDWVNQNHSGKECFWRAFLAGQKCVSVISKIMRVGKNEYSPANQIRDQNEKLILIQQIIHSNISQRVRGTNFRGKHYENSSDTWPGITQTDH